MNRLVEVRGFWSRERDIEAAMKSGTPVCATLNDGRQVQIRITSAKLEPPGLYAFTGSIADRAVEGVYGNDSTELPKKLGAGTGVLKFIPVL